MNVSPGEVAVLPQGFRFAVDLPDGPSRGYVAEVFGTHFQLPELGPIGRCLMYVSPISVITSEEKYRTTVNPNHVMSVL